jgi:hypothetical protein
VKVQLLEDYTSPGYTDPTTHKRMTEDVTIPKGEILDGDEDRGFTFRVNGKPRITFTYNLVTQSGLFNILDNE